LGMCWNNRTNSSSLSCDNACPSIMPLQIWCRRYIQGHDYSQMKAWVLETYLLVNRVRLVCRA